MSPLNIQNKSGTLEISYDWRFSFLWVVALLTVLVGFGPLGALVAGQLDALFFNLLFWLPLLWFTLTRYRNRTTIRVDRQALSVRHGPLWWPLARAHDIPARTLVQLYVDKSSVRVNDRPTYNLLAKLTGGTEVKLFRSEQNKDKLLQLETAIEAHLSITDDPTLGGTSDGNKLTLDPEKMRAQLEKLEPIRDWLPQIMVRQMEIAERQLKAARAASGEGRAVAPEGADFYGDDVTDTDNGPGEDTADEVLVRFPASGARPLPAFGDGATLPLFLARRGDRLTYRDAPYRIGRTTQLDFDDPDSPTGRELELLPADNSEPVHVYAQTERNRWSYYEERRLDDGEVSTLGFDGTFHPLRFNNGDDRYYPREEQTGMRFANGEAQAVQQFIYFTTASNAQFRSLQPAGRGWEVSVMEPVDIGFFEEA